MTCPVRSLEIRTVENCNELKGKQKKQTKPEFDPD